MLDRKQGKDIDILKSSRLITSKYFEFLMTLKGTDDYIKLNSSYNCCLNFYRKCLSDLLKLPNFVGTPFSDDLVFKCEDYLSRFFDFDNEYLKRDALLQACILQIGYARRRIGG